MKTIFIPIFQGVEAKNILRTDIFPSLLAQPDVRIVFFVATPERAAYYTKEFAHERVVYEVIERFVPPRFDSFFEYLKFRLVCNSTIDLRRRRALESGGSRIGYISSFLITRLFGNSFFRRIARWLDYRLVHDSFFAPYFEKYQPSAVFLAHLFGDIEVAMLREARRRGVHSIGMINSWDKLSGRAMMRLLPDTLVAFNEILKAEAMQYAEMPAERIAVTGVPQFDLYFKGSFGTREALCKKLGLEAKKKIIVYSPMGKANSASDWEIIDLLQSFITSGQLGKPASLLVRFPPNDFVDEAELKKRPWMIYDIPGTRFTTTRGFGLEWDMSFADLLHLRETLQHSDVFVSYASTIIIDAAIFDKPVININFEVKANQPISLMPTSFYVAEHYVKALRTGGVRLAKTKEELATALKAYLENPALDQVGRRRLVEEQCWKRDGEAGKRVAAVILTL